MNPLDSELNTQCSLQNCRFNLQKLEGLILFIKPSILMYKIKGKIPNRAVQERPQFVDAYAASLANGTLHPAIHVCVCRVVVSRR
jgi:hypothetical protein